MKRKTTVFFGALCALAMLSGCASADQRPEQPASSGGRLNLVQTLGLEDSERIEIMEFDQDDIDPIEDYLPLTSITNQSEVEEIIFLLDGELVETPAVFCIPDYRLRFWLEDGVQVDLGFSCEGAEFITGEQPVFGGRQFAPPGKFSGLIRSYFEEVAQMPETVNLLKAAGFTDVNRIEVLEQNLEENSAEVNLVLVIEDIEVIEEILFALSGDFTLQPQPRCPVNYFISFTMDDNRTVTYGYMCTDDGNGILRGDQDYFFDQDIHLGADFVELFERLVGP